MKTLDILFTTILLLGLVVSAAPAQDLDLTTVLDDGDDVLKEQMEETKGGDLKEFKIVTDDNITGLEEGDIYKNNSTFFKVIRIKKKGEKGGLFVVQRTSGDNDPMRVYTRVSGLGPLEIASRETLLTRFASGGALMYPIATLLLLVIVIAINNTWVYRQSKQCPDGFAETAREAILRGDVEGFGQVALDHKGLLPAVCRSMVIDFDISTEDEIRMRAETEARRQISALRLPLRTLNFAAAVAPLLGLLGTVIGMIACFDSLADQAASAGKAQAMAAGIKVALLTTAFGLCVAVPALLTFFVFNQRLSRIIADCDTLVTEFVHRLGRLQRTMTELASRGEV